MKMIISFLNCLACGEVMRGICDYDAREICEPCGGKAKIEHPSRRAADEDKQEVA